KAYVATYVKTCPICQANKDPRKKSSAPMGFLPTSHPWHVLSIDLWDGGKVSVDGNRYVLSVVDNFSKYAFAIPIPDKSADTIAVALWKKVFVMFGAPEYLHSDNGTEFVNEVLAALSRRLNIERTRTTPYHPASNGIVERFHKFLRNAIASFVREDHRYWDEFIDGIMLAYNTAIHEATGFQPAHLMFGRSIVSPTEYPIYHPDLDKGEAGVLSYSERLDYFLQKAQNMILERFENRRLKRSGVNAPLTKFKEGDPVMIQKLHFSQDETPKLAGRWIGPYQISRRGRNPKVYYVRDELGEKKYPVSVWHIKPFKTRSYPVIEEITDSNTHEEEEEKSQGLPPNQGLEASQPRDTVNSAFQIRTTDVYSPPLDLDIDDLVPRDQTHPVEIKDKEMIRAFLQSRDAYIDPASGKTFLKARMIPAKRTRTRKTD
ncbi:MAG TPA: DDE-type integrase/transposase/recombinase, partial [Chitinophagaceae bacterium]|nr:DDE-type integrase/transposase/recombinase [Chitinophagaceae bacterium]